MAPSVFASAHEERSAQQRGFYRFLTWPFILAGVAVAASEAHAQKLAHQRDAYDRPPDDTKSVATEPSDEDLNTRENAGKASTEDGASAGPTPIPNPTLQSQAPAEAPPGGGQHENGASDSQQASPSGNSPGASGGGSGTSPSILTPHTGDGESAGLSDQALGFGGTLDLSHALQALDDLPVSHIVPAPALFSSAADAIEGIVAATTPLTTIAIVPTIAEGMLGAVREQIEAPQAALETLAVGTGQTIEAASVTAAEAVNVLFDGLDSATDLLSSGGAIATASATVAEAANVMSHGLDSATELVSSHGVIEAAPGTATEAANVRFDGLDSATELVSSEGSLVFEDSRPPMVDVLLDKGGYTYYGIEVGRAVDATAPPTASESDPETDTSSDAVSSLLPDTVIKGVDDDVPHQAHYIAGDGIL